MSLPPNQSEQPFPRGSYPALLTAFHDDGSIDWNGVDRLTDHCIDTGAAGIFACGLSAEVLLMDDDEKVALAERIIGHAAGRVPIVAAAISDGSIEAQAELIRRMHDAGADAVAIGVSFLAGKDDSDDVWIANAESLLEHLPGDVRLGMYECPLPYHRLLSEQTLSWSASSGRFHFLKDTCCCADTLRVRQGMLTGSRLQLYNANTATLLSSLQGGADGFCGIGANYMPELYTWLCESFREQPDLATELHRFLDGTVSITEDSTYPASAKNYLQQKGIDIGTYSRKVPAGITAEGAARLAEMLNQEREWVARILPS